MFRCGVGGCVVLCDRCGQREATIRDVSIVKGAVRETNLCETCADEMRSATAGGQSATLGEWLAGLGMMAADAPKFPAPARPSKAVACPVCGLRFLDLKKTGLVGCQTCYETFETRLTPLLRNAHDGGVRHIGKVPAVRTTREVVRVADVPAEGDAGGGETAVQDGEPGSIEDRIESLTHKLALAIDAENYEKAAAIRDELAELTGDGRGGLGGSLGGGGGASGPGGGPSGDPETSGGGA